MLDVLDGDLTLWYAVDTVPEFLRKEILRRAEYVFGDNPGCDLALGVQQASGLQQAPLCLYETAGDRRYWFAFYVRFL